MGQEYYLLKKYGHTYKFLDYADPEHNSGDIDVWEMFTMPMPALVDIYKQSYKVAPKTFMDCGAGFGYMVRWASLMGIDAYGIEKRKYRFAQSLYNKFFKNGRIKICNVLDVPPFTQDLAYVNTVFTYMNEEDLDCSIAKFKNVKMLVAIHITTEDVAAAKRSGMCLDLGNQSRLLRSNDWWVERFRKNGFDAVFVAKYSCFRAIPKTR